jgi:hypothetical protein
VARPIAKAVIAAITAPATRAARIDFSRPVVFSGDYTANDARANSTLARPPLYSHCACGSGSN